MKCEICEINRPVIVDRCHIIPQRITRQLIGFHRFTAFTNSEGKNILYLCKNHHTLFDNFRLDELEWEKILPKILKMKKEIITLLNSDMKPKGILRVDYQKNEFNKKYRTFTKWKHHIGETLVAFDILEYNGKTN